jgi:hypothetical protein
MDYLRLDRVSIPVPAFPAKEKLDCQVILASQPNVSFFFLTWLLPTPAENKKQEIKKNKKINISN